MERPILICVARCSSVLHKQGKFRCRKIFLCCEKTIAFFMFEFLGILGLQESQDPQQSSGKSYKLEEL